jgi:hypothetical protein
VRSILARTWPLALAWGILPYSLIAQEAPGEKDSTAWPPQVHPWGEYQPGAWKLVRITTENYNDQGALFLTNLCDIKTTLAKRDADSLTLEERISAEACGQPLDRLHTFIQGFHGEMISPTMHVKEPIPGEVEVENRKIPCLVRQVESVTPTSKTVSTLYYSPNVPPYLLKRLSVTTDRHSNQVLSETTMTVLALDMPFKFQGALMSAAYVKTVQKTPQGTTFTLATVCPKIPGGIVSHTLKELDAGGRLIRRSTLELLDYGTKPEPDHPIFFNRRRPGRHR